jgi:lipopolysaccharide export system protein LptC
MISRGSVWLPLVILLVLAGLSFWIESMVQLPSNGDKAGHAQPESIIENFEATRTDAEGNPQYQLSARRLKHYSGSRLTEMESAQFVHLSYQGSEVRAIANHATISADGKEVELLGNVQVVRAATSGMADMMLKTAQLRIYPDEDRLRAQGAVEIRDNRMVAHAAAMDYDTRKRVIKLTGRVKAQYEHAKK